MSTSKIPHVLAIIIALLVLPPIFSLLWYSLIEHDVLTIKNLLALTKLETINTAFNTFLFAAGKTLVALIPAIYASYLIARTDVPLKGLFESVLIIPIVLPGFAVAISWILLFSPTIGLFNQVVKQMLGIPVAFNIYTMYGLIWTESTLTFPYACMIISSALRSVNPDLEDAAKICGSGVFSIMFRVTLPLITPAIISVILLSMVLGMEALDIPIYIGTPAGLTLFTTLIYEKICFLPPRYGEAAALSILLLALTMLLVAFHQKIIRNVARFAVVTGKMHTPKLISLGKFRIPAAISLILIMTVYVLLPIATLVVTSFFKGFGISAFSIDEFTLSHYLKALSYSEVVRSLINTFITGVIGATVGSLISLIAGYYIVRTRVKVKPVLEGLSMLPISFPGVVLAYGFFFAYVITPIYATILLIALAFVVKSIPWVLRSISGSLSQIHPELEEASTVSGASWFFTFRQIIVKLVAKGLLVGWIIAFIFNVRELAIPLILYFPKSELLAPTIFHLWENGLYNQAIALSTLLVTFVLVFIFLARRVFGKEFGFGYS